MGELVVRILWLRQSSMDAAAPPLHFLFPFLSKRDFLLLLSLLCAPGWPCLHLANYNSFFFLNKSFNRRIPNDFCLWLITKLRNTDLRIDSYKNIFLNVPFLTTKKTYKPSRNHDSRIKAVNRHWLLVGPDVEFSRQRFQCSYYKHVQIIKRNYARRMKEKCDDNDLTDPMSR